MTGYATCIFFIFFTQRTTFSGRHATLSPNYLFALIRSSLKFQYVSSRVSLVVPRSQRHSVRKTYGDVVRFMQLRCDARSFHLAAGRAKRGSSPCVWNALNSPKGVSRAGAISRIKLGDY